MVGEPLPAPYPDPGQPNLGVTGPPVLSKPGDLVLFEGEWWRCTGYGFWYMAVHNDRAIWEPITEEEALHGVANGRTLDRGNQPMTLEHLPERETQ